MCSFSGAHNLDRLIIDDWHAWRTSTGGWVTHRVTLADEHRVRSGARWRLPDDSIAAPPNDSVQGDYHALRRNVQARQDQRSLRCCWHWGCRPSAIESGAKTLDPMRERVAGGRMKPMAASNRPARETTVEPDDEPDFASEHALVTTTEAVSAGQDVHSGADIPRGLGGMDLKRTRLLD